MKKNRICILATLCTVLFTNISFSQGGCFTDWEYQTPITISNSNAIDLSEFQVKLVLNTSALISAGKMNNDASDLRFFDDCCNELCFWIEDYINTDTTAVWIKVPNIDASGNSTLFMTYGNTGASPASNSNCTFDLYEDFESDAQGSFSDECGSATQSFNGGEMTLSWPSEGVILSDATFSMNNKYTVESDVTAYSGGFLGFIWYKANTIEESYSIQAGSSTAYIGRSLPGDACQGASMVSINSHTDLTGVWAHTWAETGDIRSDVPSIGAMTSNNSDHALDDDLRLGLGGTGNGGSNGVLTMDWVRVRKWAEVTPTYALGTEGLMTALDLSSVDLGADITACEGDVVVLDAGIGFDQYAWSFTTNTNQTEEVLVAGDYSVTATTASGCSSSDTVNVTFNQTPTPSFTSSLNNLEATFSDASTSAVSYAWDFGDASGSSTDANPVYTYAAEGTYTVCLTVTGANGCADVSCSDITVNGNVGVEEINEAFFQVTPNPVNDIVYIQSDLNEINAYQFVDLSGRVIVSGLIEKGLNTIQVLEVPNGAYILKIASGTSTYTKRIFVR